VSQVSRMQEDIQRYLDTMRSYREMERMLEMDRSLEQAMLAESRLQDYLRIEQSQQSMMRLIENARQPLSQGIQSMLGAITMDFFERFESSQHQINQMNRILDSFKHDFTIIGEYYPLDSVEPEPEDDTQENLILIPHEARERIIQVDYFPFHLIETFRKNPELTRCLTPRDFERLTAELLNGLEFENVILTSVSGDGGRDIIATKKIHGIPILCAFECKKYSEENRVGISILRSLLGTITTSETKAAVGVLVTTSTFTTGSRKFILSEPRIDGKDFNALVGWLNDYKRK